MMECLKFFSLFIGIWFTTVNIARTYNKSPVPPINFALMAAAWTTFIYTIWR